MDLCKGKDNDGQMKAKLDDLELSLYVAGSKTHEAVRYKNAIFQNIIFLLTEFI